MKKLIIIFAFASFLELGSQVGINTTTPTATLDINGNLKVRETPQVLALPGYQIMAVNQGNFEVAKVEPQMIVDAAAAVANKNTSVYSAAKNGGITLLGLSLFSNWKQINFTLSDKGVGISTLFSETDYSYVVPSSGVYAVNFYFRYGSGLQASLLTGNPGIGIIKNSGGIFSTLDIRQFSGINLGLAALTVSESAISALYSLQAGDKLYFGLSGTSVLSASILGSTSNTSFHVYKISN
ncbi:hypothetical protein A0O34_02645 [Chryseobacterium glaciei]|uniref:C1q domain-containing protein n=1 Tax=Chryseobacterium glaciei TaxID=1685010 RepID=A0A172XR99_9FLAO|nr:hypothetical protein [Chryseobacterium glaciei]ANF49518.1 hypothetical protein A0O34_02645 [Chryseobacterium glaciei]